MNGHLLKLVWNRKTKNILLILELFVVSVVLLFVIGTGLYYADHYRQPLGFSYKNVWAVRVGRPQTGPSPNTLEAGQTARQLLLAMQDRPEIEAAALSLVGPYDSFFSITDAEVNARHVIFWSNSVTDDFGRALGINLTRGRWFSDQDRSAGVEPVVVNEYLAKAAFGDQDPVGQLFPGNAAPDPANSEPPRRVIGVFRDFRQGGEFDTPGGYMFRHANVETMSEPPHVLIVKVRPGTPIAFEETLTRQLHAVAANWSFELQPVEELRASNIRTRLAALIAIGLVGAFLLVMVALGLTGVLWQSVTERTQEIGLRRALGASRLDVCFQIIGEVVVLTTIATGLAALFVVQLSFAGISSILAGHILLWTIVVTAATLYALTVASALLPAHIAGRVLPAEALRYE